MNNAASTYTFLFTDIEGSTRLWEQFPDAMNTALAEHDEVMRAAVTEHGGEVFKTIGDAFCATFSSPVAALDAALQAQDRMRSVSIPEKGPIRVRMAIHTGIARARDDDYFGPALNHVARLLAVGHGGQVLLTSTAAEVVREGRTSQATLLDLGAHRLRDVSRVEHVYQVMHPCMDRDFPPLKSLESFPNNLPREMTSFVGREEEIAEIRGLLQSTSLLTLTGSGGCGKTRLAIQVASEVIPRYEGGVWLIELAPLTDPLLVPAAVARVFSLHDEVGATATDTLVRHLRNAQPTLIVLDNCEHLIDACAKLTETLLRFCPKLQMLATSRESLGVSGERPWKVPSLSMPSDLDVHSAEAYQDFEAVRLFVERAKAALPDFTISSGNCQSIASVCRRLDGIPLAIELAAARVKSLSIEQLAMRLDDRFRLLTGGSRTALPRQQTLRAAIDWSYNLLSDSERLLFRRLAVFSGGWVLDAAEAICSGDGIEDFEVIDILTQLVDKSLVQYEETKGEGRYRLLETVRQYSRDKLFESEEAIELRRRHMEFFVAFVAKVEPLLAGAEQVHWLARLQAEHDNLRSAFEWSQAEFGGAEACLRLAKSLHRFWEVRGHISEGRAWLERGLAITSPELEDLRMRALNALGALCYEQADYDPARRAYLSSLEIARKLGFDRGIAILENNLGNVATNQGDYLSAKDHFEASVEICRRLEDSQNLGNALDNLASVHCSLGEYETATKLHDESMAIFTSLGDTRSIGIALYRLGHLARKKGDFEESKRRFADALEVHQDLGFRGGIASCIEGLAYLAFEMQQFDRAATLHGAAISLRQRMGSILSPESKAEQSQCLDHCEEMLGLDRCDECLEAGGNLPTEEACRLALA